MPLDDLVSVIETLQQRIREHGDALHQNEYRTRMALIDPLLTVLGWDTADPSLVMPEYSVSGQRVDYALLGRDSKPAATLEAKKLDEPLASHLMQMLNYSNAAGIKYAGLTDGNHWELYDVFKPSQLEERRLLDLRITDIPALESALQLLLLWRPNLASGQPVAASQPILSPLMRAPSPVEPFAKTQTPTTRPPVLPSFEGWTSLASFVAKTGSNPPSEILFPDGSRDTITRWRHIVEQTVKWLWSRNLLTHSNVPLASGKRRYIVNTVPQHPAGNAFKQGIPVTETPLFVEGNISSIACIANAKALMNHCGQDQALVRLNLN